MQNDTLPVGSHVLLLGLADGRFLWESLHDKYHPLGWLNHDILYPQMYLYLSCLGVMHWFFVQYCILFFFK